MVLRFTLVAIPAVFLVGRPRVGWRWVVAIGATIAAGQFGFLFIAIDQGLPRGIGLARPAAAGLLHRPAGDGDAGRAPAPAAARRGRDRFAGIAVIVLGRAENVPLLACVLCVCAALSCRRQRLHAAGAGAAPSGAVGLDEPRPAAAYAGAEPGRRGPGAIGDALDGMDLGAVGAIAYLVLASTWFGYGAWSWLIRQNPASQVVPFTLLLPPVGIASAWLALDEVPNGPELAGGAIVHAAPALNAWAGSTARPRAASPRGPAAPSPALP